jgi:hypothetical protein
LHNNAWISKINMYVDTTFEHILNTFPFGSSSRMLLSKKTLMMRSLGTSPKTVNTLLSRPIELNFSGPPHLPSPLRFGRFGRRLKSSSSRGLCYKIVHGLMIAWRSKVGLIVGITRFANGFWNP